MEKEESLQEEAEDGRREEEEQENAMMKCKLISKSIFFTESSRHQS